MRHFTTLFAAASLAALTLSVSPGAALAGPKLTGVFVASKTCPAYRSKNDGTNPGNVMTVPDIAYEALELNMVGGDWYRIRVPGAFQIEERWVAATCGQHFVDGQTGPGDGDDDADGPGDDTPPVVVGEDGPESTNNALAVSWQPAFCETRPTKPECEALNDGELPHAVAGFSLHGLWPQGDGSGGYPAYCGDSDTAQIRTLDEPDTWDQLPEITLSAALKDKLDLAMPGTESRLDLHEWHKHGSCYFDADGAEGYYRDSLRLLEELNASAFARLVVDNVGTEVAIDDLAAAFDAAFGAGASDKLSFKCSPDGGRRLLGEILISLGGTIDDATPLATLIAAAPDADDGGCGGTVTIDPAGRQ